MIITIILIIKIIIIMIIIILIMIITATKNKEEKEAQKISTHSQALKTSREFSNFNVYFLDIHRNLLLLGLL